MTGMCEPPAITEAMVERAARAWWWWESMCVGCWSSQPPSVQTPYLVMARIALTAALLTDDQISEGNDE